MSKIKKALIKHKKGIGRECAYNYCIKSDHSSACV